jgi:hypothetical protein
MFSLQKVLPLLIRDLVAMVVMVVVVVMAVVVMMMTMRTRSLEYKLRMTRGGGLNIVSGRHPER